MATHLEKLLNRLDGVRKTTTGWIAKCPTAGHGNDGIDLHPSIVVSVNDSGDILIHCRTGCDINNVLTAINLTFSDLYAPSSMDAEDALYAYQQLSKPSTIVNYELNHEVYSQFLELLQLSDNHKDDLLKRGLNEEIIERNKYRTLRYVDGIFISKQLYNNFGDSLLSVPGFNGELSKVKLIDGFAGLVIPVRRLNGSIAALKLRRSGIPKYQYISGGQYTCGTPIHIPLNQSVGPFLLITEGELKSDICQAISGSFTIGIAGVANWELVIKLLEEWTLVEEVRIAFDWPDVLTKQPVREQLEKFTEALKKLEVKVFYESWSDLEYKGLDDLYAAGKKSVLVNTVPPLIKKEKNEEEDIKEFVPFAPCSVPFPVDIFPNEVRAYVEEIGYEFGCSYDFVAGAIFAVTAGAIGARRRIHITGKWYESSTIYMVMVGPPSSTKSPACLQILKPITDEQDRLSTIYAINKKAYYNQLAMWKQEVKAATLCQEDEKPLAPNKPLPGHIFVDDITVESLSKILSFTPKGVILYKDEFTGWVKSMGKYSKGNSNDRQFWLSAYSNVPVKVDRKTEWEDPIYIRRPAISLFGGIQPTILPELASSDGSDDGLIPRLLFVYPPVELGTDFRRAESDNVLLDLWQAIINRILALDMVEEDGILVPDVCEFTDEALDAFESYYNGKMAELRDPSFPSHLQGFYGKLKGSMARFCLILHLLRWSANDPECPDDKVIEVSDVYRMEKIAEYFIAHYKAAYGCLTSSSDDRKVTDFIKWVKHAGNESKQKRPSGRCTIRHLRQRKLAGLRSNSECHNFLRKLVDMNYGQLIEEKAANGRKVEWFVLGDVE